jgi:hypothetical protein
VDIPYNEESGDEKHGDRRPKRRKLIEVKRLGVKWDLESADERVFTIRAYRFHSFILISATGS